jgi:hypothetical protein
MKKMDSHPDIMDLMPLFFELMVPSWEPGKEEKKKSSLEREIVGV